MITQAEQNMFNRSSRLLGEGGFERLHETKVIIFGVGGVGSWCAEGLVRSGVGHLTIVDMDTVSITNINRQIMATSSTVGQVKAHVLRDRLLDINPDADIVAVDMVYSAETADNFDLDSYDYIVDAIDSLKDKAALILNACNSRARFYSSMGAALKLDPTRVRVAEFWEVKGCPLAACLRRRFKRNKTFPSRKFTCVYDDEVLPNAGETDETCSYKVQINGSIAHITSIFGMTICGLIVQQIYKDSKK